MDWKEHMNAEKAAVLVDSGCDIAQECIDKYGLWLLPLHIDYPEKAYLDGVDVGRRIDSGGYGGLFTA